MMTQEVHISGQILDDDTTLTLVELSHACEVRVEWIIELVEEGILEPSGTEIEQWCFSGPSLRLARTVQRLQYDLNVNLAGAALALQLMEENENLKVQLRILERAR
jgi:chaperone modulatory protein CbpM